MAGLSDELDQDIQNEVLPVEPDEDAIPIVLDQLQPWHRPRKQYVRSKLWLNFARRLINREKEKPGLPKPLNGNPEVKYLTLPGIDYFDVELLADLCLEIGCSLTSTGFLTSGGKSNRRAARAHVRQKSLIDRKLISKNSYTYPTRLEEIAHECHARNLVERNGPFHIVNIDACGSVASPSADHSTRLIDAIHRILDFQFQHKSGRWLLFLCTDARRTSIHGEVIDRLLDPIRENAQSNFNFNNRLTSIFGNAEMNAVERAAANSGITFLKFFALGFSKWLIHLAKSQNWQVKTHETYCYPSGRGGNHDPTIVSMAFEFIRSNSELRDSFGITRVESSNAKPIEDTSVRAANKVDEMENVINRLNSCNTLREEMKNQTKKMLEDAGYEAEAISKLEEI